MRTITRRTAGILVLAVLLPLMSAANCPDGIEGPDDVLDVDLVITDPDPDLNRLVASEPLIVRATVTSESPVTDVVYRLNDGPEEDCGGNVESILCNLEGLSQGVNTIRVTARTRAGEESSDEVRVFFNPAADGPSVVATLDPGELEIDNAEAATRTVRVLFWRTPDHFALLGASASDLPRGVEAETVSCSRTDDDIIRRCTVELTFPPGMLPGDYEIRIGWGNSTIVGLEVLPVRITGTAPAGCEGLRLILDFEPEIPSPGRDFVGVFVERAPDVEGQVQLTLIEPEGIDTYSFGPNPVPADEESSTLDLTLVEGIDAGTVLEMAIRGAIPLLEDPSFECTIPLSVTVIDPANAHGQIRPFASGTRSALNIH